MDIYLNEGAYSVPCVTLAGSMDVNGAKEIQGPLDRVADQTKNLVIDLSGVEYISSTGVGVLLGLAQDLSQNGGKLVLAAPQDQVLNTLTLMKIGDVIKITNTLDQAIAAISG